MSKPRARPAPALSRNPDSVYRTYLSQCRRLGVKPAPIARAKSLIREWVAELARQEQQPQIDAGAAIGASDMPT